MFFYRLGDFPDALETDWEDDHITGAKADGVGAFGLIGDGDFTFQKQAGLGLIVFPGKGTDLATPGGPGFTLPSFGVTGFFHDDIFYARHDNLPIY
jgi:hypothetical protein